MNTAMRILALCSLLVTVIPAYADEHYAHEHIIHALPRGHISVVRGRDHFFYSNGYWYRGYGHDYIAVVPPIGLRVGVLPWGYRAVVVGGLTYFVLNDIWYQQVGPEYVVVTPPAGATTIAEAAPAPAPAAPVISSDNFFMYPRNGQNEQQQAQDRYECHHWATEQTGYDPTLPLGGVPESASAQKRADYQRAMSACLDGRGYTVR